MAIDNFKAQNRGGHGIKGISTIDGDYVTDLLMTTTHNHVMFFTSTGRVYTMKTYKIPEASRTSRGTAIVNLLQLGPDEKITAIIPVGSFEEGKNLFMVTKKGTVKKTPIEDFSNIRKNGIRCINLEEDDELIEVKTTRSSSEIFLVTKNGMCIRFKETDVRAMGRDAMGVRGMMLDGDDEIIGMQIDSQGSSLLVVSENGYGKRTKLEEFKTQYRGGKGLKCYRIIEKTGRLVGVKAVNDEHEVMMITDQGTIIQLRMSDVSIYSRITSGVRLIKLDEGANVVSIAKVREKVSDGSVEYENMDDAMEDTGEDEVVSDDEDFDEDEIESSEDSGEYAEDIEESED
jgi:DNA gyrase subunit A